MHLNSSKHKQEAKSKLPLVLVDLKPKLQIQPPCAVHLWPRFYRMEDEHLLAQKIHVPSTAHL